MRKTIFIATVLLLILSFNIVSFAETSVNVSVDGTPRSVRQVAVLVDGQKLNTEVPSFIMGDRTLVPIRFVAESFGAVVGWDQDTKTAIVVHDNNVVSLSIDNTRVVVNGETRYLDKNSTPKLVTFPELKDSRTMVPVRFISEVLGYDVDWDGNSYTAMISTPKVDVPNAENITVNNIGIVQTPNGDNRVQINGTGKLSYRTMYITQSNKLVIDIDNAMLRIPGTLAKPGEIYLDGLNLYKVNYAQFTQDPDPYVTRVVLTLYEQKDHRIVTKNNGNTIEIAFDEYVDEEIKEEIDEITEEQKSGLITTGKIDGKNVIYINGLNNPQYSTSVLKDPTRIVIDIKDTIIQGELYQVFNNPISFVDRIRASQYVPDPLNNTENIVRVVLDIKDGVNDPRIEIRAEENRLIIVPEENIWDHLGYEKFDNIGIFTIKNQFPSAYTVNYDNLTKEMFITMPNFATSLPEGNFIVNDNIVRRIIISKDQINTTVNINFRRTVNYNVLSNLVDQQIRVQVERINDITPQDRTIVIDPGHGGKDPGAVFGSLYEKDIILNISLKLQQALLDLGYNVIMTRETDVFVELYDRPEIANKANADLFISIHANSNIKPEIHGLEVLYASALEATLKLDDQYPFANSIYDNILALTGNSGTRSIVNSPRLAVLRRTYMPAVLIEVGYMSNAKERELIVTEAFQTNVVDGIVNGIIQYFNEY